MCLLVLRDRIPGLKVLTTIVEFCARGLRTPISCSGASTRGSMFCFLFLFWMGVCVMPGGGKRILGNQFVLRYREGGVLLS